MSTHRSRSARSRRRRGDSASASGRGRTGALWAGLAALTVLGASGFAVAGWADDGEKAAGSRGSSSPGPTPPGDRLSPGTTPSGPVGNNSPVPPRSSPTPPVIPATGPGTFVVAPGGSAQAGKGKALRYRVEVEKGLALSAVDVARQVEDVLADRRGWTADGRSAFRRVSGGAADFVVRVATPGTVDEICGRFGLDTDGEVNCNVADKVMVNLKRWLLATPVYAKDVTAYRALIINHEVGHFLGHGHVDCPGPGRPAPAMMQQIKGMRGCVPNVWPYDAKGRLVTGPTLT
ncbi:DUF3152 domain-containing protein [Streptomyces sp. NPDC102395]|uniref:DUF3152 domain-containing protein n=1 Tax=Streptomyces sp. NPDC102395 TaxID=3366168 RepID=UPI00381BC292